MCVRDACISSRRGFTLAELLIVVAIITVLVAVAIPVFAGQLERSRESVDAANIRSQYAEVMVEAISGGDDVNIGGASLGKVALSQRQDGWQASDLGGVINSVFARVEGSPAEDGLAWVEYSGGQAVLHYSNSCTDPYSIDTFNVPTVNYTFADGASYTVPTMIMSNKPSRLQEVFRDALGDASLTVSCTNLHYANKYVGEALAQDLAKNFAGTTQFDKFSDKVLTVKGSSGTYQYYYKKVSGAPKLFAIREVTSAMLDERGAVIHKPMTETDKDGWVAYAGA